VIDPNANNLDEIQDALDRNFPSPEEDLVKLSLALAYSPDGDPYMEARFLVLEVDNLIAQLRWHLGQVVLLAKRYPHVLKGSNEEEVEEGEPEELAQLPKEMPTRSHLLLRGYISRPEQVLFSDLCENWRGGTVAGWIYHMMIDDAVARSLAILDRLAAIVSLVGNVEFEKVYFRSGKLKVIHRDLNTPETKRLLEIAEGDVLNLLIEYRDGWNHTQLTHSAITGFMPADSYINESGQYVRVQSNQLTGELLFALARAAFDQVAQVLREVRLLCEQRVPKDTRRFASKPSQSETSQQIFCSTPQKTK